MEKQAAVDVLASSMSYDEWDKNCQAVKPSPGEYPTWWYQEVIENRLFADTSQKWKKNDKE